MASLDGVLSFALVLWMATSAHVVAAQEMTEATELELCDLKVPDAVAQANATFTMMFSAIRGPDGSLKGVKRVRGAFLDDAPFTACMKGWRVAGPVDERVVVAFDWVHAKGWTTIRVLGKTSSLTLRIAPGACGSAYQQSAEQN